MPSFGPISAAPVGVGPVATVAGPIVTSVTVSPSAAAGSASFTAVASGTGAPDQIFSWAASAGAIVASSGSFTAPGPTNVPQSITITATHVQSGVTGTATVIIAAIGGGASFATAVTFAVVDDETGLAVPDTSGLDFAFFEQPRLKDVLAPIVKGASFSIVGSVVTFSIAGITTMYPGEWGRIQWETPDGTKAGGGRVQVS